MSCRRGGRTLFLSVVMFPTIGYPPPLLRRRLQPLLLLGRQGDCSIRCGGAGAKQKPQVAGDHADGSHCGKSKEGHAAPLQVAKGAKAEQAGST